MSTTLFKSKAASIRKKLSFAVSEELVRRVEAVEKSAEIAGVSFPFEEHVERAIERLLTQAERQLTEMDGGGEASESSLSRGSSRFPTA